MKTLYENLNDLVENNEAFYKSTQSGDDGSTYEIFLYRLASYTDFQEPGAIEARGIMFRDGEIVSRPMEKFWNHGECNQWPEHEETNWDEYTEIMVKEDGSLISTYLDVKGNLRLKTKGSLHSDQVHLAEIWLNTQPKFKAILLEIEEEGYTINMEIVSPNNRIVILYPETKLVILNVRNRKYGDYMPAKYLRDPSPSLKKYWVKYETDIKMEDVAAMKGEDGTVIEGFVFQHPVSQHKVKCKTDRYVELHHAKDDVNHPKRLLGCVLEEGSDDLRSLFHDDPLTIKIIDDFEEMVFHKYNHIVARVEEFVENNKELERKDFAIKGQKDMSDVFSLVMQKWLGKDVNYKTFVFKNREFIFKDVNWRVQ